MSDKQVYHFLKQNTGTAYSLRELSKRIKTSSLSRKLVGLRKVRMINIKRGIVDYNHYKNARVKYYHYGTAKTFIPTPKRII